MTLPGIYIHLPFCAVRCSYCDFPLTTRVSLSERFYAALRKEIDSAAVRETADTLYFGGGTPSMTPAHILKELKGNFQLTDDAEISLEANPDDIDESSLQQWSGAGINRLSIGVQSLEEKALQWMLRRHSAREALDAVRHALADGSLQVNVDLILGAPHQTPAGFLEGLNRLIDLNPDHFSVYFLEIHDNTALEIQLKRKTVAPMEEEDQITSYLEAISLLRSAGYVHYEVSNFARDGCVSRHNLKYWTNQPYYAFGPGACSYIRSMRSQNIRSITDYIEKLETGRMPVEARTWEDSETTRRNALIFGLRKVEGVDISEFQQNFGISPLSLFRNSAVEYMQQNLLEIDGTRLRLTLPGLLVSNEILSNII